ncbi:hypothetical protein IFR05_012121 [Cadophora sp. M221]|nr:hypothetical protein IFR05_012121 [Cadophora sp. M221]
MDQETPNRGGRSLGDFEGTPSTHVEDIYEESRELLHASRRTQSQARDSIEPIKLEDEDEMATQDPEQVRVDFSSGNSSNQTPKPRRHILDGHNSSASPFVIDDSPYSTPQAQPRVAKRPSSPSLTQNGSAKRQQTRHNTTVIMSPSRPLSHGPVDSLFGLDTDREEHVALQHRERVEGENGYKNGDLYHPSSRSVKIGNESERCQVSRPSSARNTPSRGPPPSIRQTPSREHYSSAQQMPSREYYSASRQTPSRDQLPSTRQTLSREYTSSSQEQRSSSQLHRTPQQLPRQRGYSPYDPNRRIVEDPYRQARVNSVSTRPGNQKFHKEIDLEDHNMQLEDEVVPMPLVRAASMMREVIRAQSRPPQRGATVPPESFRDRPLYEEASLANGSRSVRTRTPGLQRDIGGTGSYNSHSNIDKNGYTPQQPSRHQNPKPDGTPKKFILDTLDNSSESETEDVDMTTFFRGPKRNGQGPRSRQKSSQSQNQVPFRRAQTAAPEVSQSSNYQQRPNTPKLLQRQSESDKYAVKSLQLQSPIWAPGADHRVSGSVTRPRTPFRDQNGAANGFHEEQRSRSRSVAPHTPFDVPNRSIQNANEEHRSRSRSVAPCTPFQAQNGTAHIVHEEHRGRSRSVAPRTPALDRVRSQSQYGGSPSRNPPAKPQAYEHERMETSQSQPQTPQNQNHALNGDDKSNVFSGATPIRTPQQAQLPKTPNRAPQNSDFLHMDSSDTFDTPLDAVIRKNQRQAQKPPPIQNGITNAQKVSSVIPSGSAFAKKAKPEAQKLISPDPVTPTNRVSSGRGFKDTQVIDLITPEGPSRSVSMKERIAPAVKKPAPKKPVAPSASLAKPSKSTGLSPKRVAKEKAAPIDPEEVRQKRVAEIIIDRKKKSDEVSLDMALFGEIVHDQAAEDKKAEEARARGQREREAKMAAMLAKEKAAEKAAEEEKKQKYEEAEKRRLAKEIEEQQKRVKREADRKRQLAHENREKEILRRAAEEKIRLDREKQAKEEEQRELDKQKAKAKAEFVQAEAEELAKLRAKQEQAKLQAASLSSAKIPSVADPKRVEEPEFNVEDEESLFMPEASPVVPDKAKPNNRSAPKASNSNDLMAQVSSMTTYRAEKEAEEMRKELEQSKRIQEKLGARYNRPPSVIPPNPAPVSRTEPPAPRPKPVSRPDPIVERSKSVSPPEPEPVVEKPATAPAPAVPKAPPPKKDRPAPQPKGRPGPKPKSTRDKIYESFRSQSSSSSGDIPPAPNYLQRLAAKNLFKDMPNGFSSFGRTKAQPEGPKPRVYKHKVTLISDLEREELEKKQQNRGRVRDNRRMSEKQKQDAANKRTEKAREKQIEKIREDAEKKGTEISEEELKAQVDAFMEKRAQDLQKRAETLARKEQDPGHDFGRNPLILETLTPAQQLLCDTENEDGLSVEDLQLKQKRREDLASKVALGKIRNSAFDKASARKTTAHFTDSEESEEDPDPEPEHEIEGEVIQQQQSTEDDEEEESSIEESGSESESDDDTEIMSPMPEMSASFTARAAEADRDVHRKRIQSLDGQTPLPGGGPSPRMITLYQVWKLERTKSPDGDEDETHRQMVEQFATLAEANAFASDIVQNKFRTCQYHKLEESYKGDKYRAAIRHDATHESQISIVEMPVGPSELSPEFIASIPHRIPEKFWDVMQYTSRRIIDEETGEISVHHGIPKRHGQFSVLEMANHEASEQLIKLFRPAGGDGHYIKFYQDVSEKVREARDQANADGECFQVEVERDSIPEWMNLDNINMLVECVEIQGPLN